MKKFYPVIHVLDKNQTFRNVDIAIIAEADGIFLISHGSLNYKELLILGKEIKDKYPDLWIGFNFLDISVNDFFTFFNSYPNYLNSFCDAVWFDNSYRGVNDKEADIITSLWKESSFKGELFGGVAFKYVKQPGSLVEAVKSSIGNMSVITTSGDGTGQAARPYKIKVMSEAIPDNTPLAIASGIDADNIENYLQYIDIFLISTGISIDHSNLDLDKTIQISKIIHKF